MICKRHKAARSFVAAALIVPFAITADTLALCYLGAARHNGFVTAVAENSPRRMEMYISDLHILPQWASVSGAISRLLPQVTQLWVLCSIYLSCVSEQ